MSADRDLDRIVRSWLREDGSEDADRVLDLVLDQLDATPRRRANWLVQRFSFMSSNPVRFGAIAAAAAIVAILGFSVIRGGDVGDADRTPTPSPGAETPAPSAASPTRAGLPFPPEQTGDEPQRYGWPDYDNVITFTVPAGRWDASGAFIHAHVEDATVDFRFAHVCRLEAGEPSSVPLSCEGDTYAPQGADEVAVVVAGYQGWYRELPSGQLQEWILDFDGRWVSIQLRIYGDVDPAVVDEAMALLESIQAAPRE